MKRGIVRVLALLVVLAGLVATASAQTGAQPSGKAPSTAAQPYVVMTGQSLADVEKGLQPANKTKQLTAEGGIGARVVVQHEKDVNTNPAEVHDAGDDIFFILEGTAVITLGGTLDNPREEKPGEWRATHITGGREVKVSKGDLIIVPRGTAHQRSTAGQDVTLMLIKILK